MFGQEEGSGQRSPVAGVEIDHPYPPSRDLRLGHNEASEKVEKAIEVAGQDCRNLDVGG